MQPKTKGKVSAEEQRRKAQKRAVPKVVSSARDKIVVNVGRHLSSSKEHITKGSSHYIRLLKTAQRYTGTAELQVYLEKATPKDSEEED